ncbi:hypothetical protein [uncultured Prevotella sp.]|uniref:hypothetical protein n=1 Tax=uncultured Prevotella sp. TaxID=159272 RepID=UPI0027DCEB1E|nr:hypothetical protein [uncultured Prevotella sp.]
MKEMQTDHNNISEHRQELKLRILRTAMPLFKQRGIKAVGRHRSGAVDIEAHSI